MRAQTAGKRVDTWIYAYQGPVHKEDDDRLPLVRSQKVEVKVLILKKNIETDTPPHATGHVEFMVECDCPKFALIGRDIELLRAEAIAKCDEHYATNWEPYYLVKVIPVSMYGSSGGAGIDFTYSEVQKGTAWDGALLLRSDRYRKTERIEAWPGEFRAEGGKVIACIAATDENTAALKEFASRIDTLRDRLSDLLKPAVIMQTLTNLSQLALLPAKPTKTNHESDTPNN